MVEAVLGPIVEVDAKTEILWPTIKLTDTGVESARETADHAGILGKTQSGAVFRADISGGVSATDARFRFEISGSAGWLSLTSDHPYGFQAGDLKVTSGLAFLAPEEPVVSGGLMGAAINVGEVYSHLVRDVRAGTYSTPGFEHAVHNARLIEAVMHASECGVRQNVTLELVIGGAGARLPENFLGRNLTFVTFAFQPSALGFAQLEVTVMKCTSINLIAAGARLAFGIAYKAANRPVTAIAIESIDEDESRLAMHSSYTDRR